MNSEVIQSAVQENTVYVGRWTDWSHGPIMGATLTLTHRDGGFIIAFVTLFVTITGARFWAILSFITHIVLSREAPQDAIYNQRQAILRNADSSSSGLWKLLRMLWAWRRNDLVSLLTRILPSLLLSFTTLVVFALAGIFSSRVATSEGGEVLISSPNCGTFIPDNAASAALDSASAYVVRRLQFSSNYALLCYGNSSFAEDCPTYLKKSLPFNVTRNVPCPFPGQDRICRTSDGAIRLDSGFINSHSDLGINAPPEQRFLYRSVTECTPLLTEGFSQHANLTGESDSVILAPLLNYFYGESHMYGNATYQYSDSPPQSIASQRGGYYGIYDYILGFNVHYGVPKDAAGNSDLEWKPVPELAITDGDVNLLFLSANDIKFLNPVEDPWYSAQIPKGNFTGTYMIGEELNGVVPIWARDSPVRPLGCVERYQFCNPNHPANSSCTSLGGIFQVSQEASQLYQDEAQLKHVSWSLSAISDMAAGVADLVATLGAMALQSRNGLHSGLQATLSDNQWELEVESFFKVTMADLQRSILEQATGPTDPAMRQFLVRPNSTEERTACANQKIRSQSFTSVNLLGLTIIFVVGGLIIVASFVLPMAVELFQRRWRKRPFASLEWITNDTLQLQRLAHEAVGSGTWQGACGECPTTVPGELLAVLDITHPDHPILKAQEKDDVIGQV